MGKKGIEIPFDDPLAHEKTRRVGPRIASTRILETYRHMASGRPRHVFYRRIRLSDSIKTYATYFQAF